MRILAAIVIAAAMFGVPSTSHEYRCFLHCDGEPETETTALGWPVVYWSHDVLPGDPPRVSPARWDPAGLVLDLITLGLLMCAFAIAWSAATDPMTSVSRVRGAWASSRRATARNS